MVVSRASGAMMRWVEPDDARYFSRLRPIKHASGEGEGPVRARITPGQTGLPTNGTRRIPGLRREEVASLAGVVTTTASYLRAGGVMRITVGCGA
jgi:hypothetical protein